MNRVHSSANGQNAQTVFDSTENDRCNPFIDIASGPSFLKDSFFYVNIDTTVAALSQRLPFKRFPRALSLEQFAASPCRIPSLLLGLLYSIYPIGIRRPFSETGSLSYTRVWQFRFDFARA